MGFITGILSGFGIGGGTLLMLYMVMFAGISQRSAQGINLLYFLPAAGTALIGHVKNRLVDKRAFFISAGVGVAATLFSAWAVGFMDASILRKVFGVFLIFIAISELFRKRD